MKTATRILLLALLLAGALRLASAEVSNEPANGGVVITFGGVAAGPGGGGGGGNGDPLPWPIVRFGAFRQNPRWFLNSGGGDGQDGPGALAVDPSSGRRDVVWARFNGSDYDIVMSSSDGTYWETFRPVSLSITDERDPAIAVDAGGARHIVWWRVGNPDQVLSYEESLTGEAAQARPLPLAGSAGDSRPSVALYGGEVWVAFQEANPAGGSFVVVARRTSEGWVRDRLAETPFAGPDLDGDIKVEIHAAAGRMWIDWVDAPGLMACKTYETNAIAWAAAQYDSYQSNAFAGDSEYMAQEGARQRFRLDTIQP